MSVTPANGAINVPDNSAVTVVFSNPMDAVTFNSTTTLVLYNPTTSAAVPATITLSPDLTTATLTPTSPLVSGQQYTIYVNCWNCWGSNLTDLAGNVLYYGSNTSFFAN